MSRFIFIHDFYRDGYHDMLAEVRELQACGQWTKEKRARVRRYEIASYLQLKHHFPRMDMGYFAGRVAAIKSATTAHYPIRGKMIFCALPDGSIAFCKMCGDSATWECGTFKGDDLMVLCDRCKQERVREQTAYITPSGWDWDEHELLPVPVGDKLVIKEQLEPESFLFPSALLLGLGILSLTLYPPLGILLLQLWLSLQFAVHDDEMPNTFRKLFKSEL